MSNIDLKIRGEQISLIPKGVLNRDEEPKTIKYKNHNISVNLHPNEGSHWDLVISGERLGAKHYFDKYGIEAQSLYLQMYLNKCFDDRIQRESESYCGACCL